MKYNNILLIVDLEGIIGMKKDVTLVDARMLMIKELQYIVDIIYDYNPKSNISICDAHNDGTLLNKGLTNESITYINGIDNLANCNWNFDCALLIGFHAMANKGSHFDHTFRNDIVKIYYEDTNLSLGEIASLITWIETKNIPVILVSAEGNFTDEVVEKNCYIHKVVYNSVQDEQYAQLCYLLNTALNNPIDISLSKIQKKVVVLINNPDKLNVLSSKGFTINSTGIVFESVEKFFLSLYEFAYALNSAAVQVMKDNKKLAQAIRSANISKEDCSCILYLLSKPIDEICASERDYIRRCLDL